MTSPGRFIIGILATLVISITLGAAGSVVVRTISTQIANTYSAVSEMAAGTTTNHPDTPLTDIHKANPQTTTPEDAVPLTASVDPQPQVAEVSTTLPRTLTTTNPLTWNDLALGLIALRHLTVDQGGHTRTIIERSVGDTADNLTTSISEVSSTLTTYQTAQEAAITTATLTVTGNTTIDGTLTAGSLAVAGVSSGGAVTAPYFTATSTTATSTFAGALTVGNGSFRVSPSGALTAATGVTSSGAITFSDLTGGILYADGTGQLSASSTIAAALIEDAYVRNTGDAMTGNLTMSGTSANIALGSNWLSGDGDDEGVFVGSNGNVGIGTTGPLAKLQVGGLDVSNSTDAQILLSRPVDDLGYAGSGHGFSDSSNVNRSGGIAYNSYDARITVSGSNDYDHFSGFQANPIVGTSGTTGIVYGFNAAPVINTGTATHVMGMKIFNPTGTGTVTNAYGLYIQNQTKGASTNYSIYSEGGSNYFGGNVGIGEASPTAKLHVEVAGDGEAARIGNTDGRYMSFGGQTTPVGAWLGYGGDQDITVLSDGKVGIASTTPYAKLSVTNTGSAPSFIVEDSTSPDSTPFIIDAAGNVGIGTTSPYAKLSVKGSGTGTGKALSISDSNNVERLTVLDNGNVGIGTTSPATELHIASTRPTLRLSDSDFTDYAEIDYNFGQLYIGADNTNVRSGSIISFSIDGSEKMRVNNDGNVGIGTTAPGAKLDVDGQMLRIYNRTSGEDAEIRIRPSDNNRSGSLVFDTGNIARSLIELPNASANLEFRNTSTGARNSGFDFYNDAVSDSTPLFRIANTGNVGIGETAPGSKLSVSGGATVGAGYDTTAAPANGLLVEGNVGIGTASPSAKLSVAGTLNTTGAATFNAAGGSTSGANTFAAGSNVIAATFGSGSTSGFTANQYGGAVRFNGSGVYWGDLSYYPNGGGAGNEGNFRFSRTSSVLSTTPSGKVGVGELYSAGNVGIGDTTPASLLTVGASDAFQVTSLGRVLANVGASGAGNLAYSFVGDTDTGIYRSAADEVRLQTAGSDRMTIDASGNVGIGATAPQSKLEVRLAANTLASFGTNDNTSGNYSGIHIGYNASNLYRKGALVFEAIGDGATRGKIHILNNGAANSSNATLADARLTVNYDGNVGIGTTTPASILHVSRNSSTATEVVVQNPLAGTAAIGRFQARNGDAATDAVTLGVVSTAFTTSGGLVQDGGYLVTEGGLSGGLTIGTRSASDIRFYTTSIVDANERMRITAAGNIGIATSTPTETLSVEGTVGFHALTGATGAGSLCLSSDGEVVYNATSDACLPSLRDTKNTINPLTLNALDTLSALESVSFIYNDSDGRTRYGFIAEDVALVDTLLATYDADGALSGIDDRSMLAVVVKGVQEVWTVLKGYADIFTTKKLCLEDVCITKSELQDLLDKANTPSAQTPAAVESEPEDDDENAGDEQDGAAGDAGLDGEEEEGDDGLNDGAAGEGEGTNDGQLDTDSEDDVGTDDVADQEGEQGDGLDEGSEEADDTDEDALDGEGESGADAGDDDPVGEGDEGDVESDGEEV